MTLELLRALSSFPLLPGSLPVSAFPFPSLILISLFHGMSAGPPRVSALSFPPRFPPVSFPLSCVRFFSSFVSREFASGLPHLWFAPFAYALAVWLTGTVAFSSPKRCGCVFPSFPRNFFPFLSSVLSTSVRPHLPRPTDEFDDPRLSFDCRFYHPEFGVRFCGPRFAPERAPHHSPRAATLVGTAGVDKPFLE